ncbi:hypothetical protein ILP92_11420 [Maribius pontilimi]|uniref:Uncharacterized protein n=1 Tax=Palleronia pontilimi TaxID=1964209 RepID=A0A934IIU1_9RHOB|nr:hypothetical protein [Palleronia pontilimi]MBJ3763355.1 hypothetical protein [Palleronia pontilimi]
MVFLALLLFGSSRSFLVEARTGGLKIEFSESSNSWRLPDAVLCLPLEIPTFPPDPDCGIAAKSDGPPNERLIAWADGTIVEISGERGGGIRIEAMSGNTATLPMNAAFIVSRNAWQRAGALTFRGYATIGQDMSDGASHYLREGRWEAREAGWLTSVFRSVTEVVKTGDLPTGAKVTAIIDGEPALAYGHLARGMGPRDEETGLDVTMISEFGDTALSVRHFGLRNAVVIKPDWIDVAISSPLLLAVAALFSILASFVQVLMLGLSRPTDAVDKPVL